MPSATAFDAISTALRVGKAVLKFITPNELGLTGSNQCGFYLPKQQIDLFSPHQPLLDQTLDSWVSVKWHDGLETRSRVVWYGKKKKRGSPNPELRLTNFGPNFRWLDESLVGSVLCLVPESLDLFYAFVLETEEDIEAVQAGIGVEIHNRFGIYRDGSESIDQENTCLETRFEEFARELTEFPTGQQFSEATWTALEQCLRGFRRLPPDSLLRHCVDAEYQLFRVVERHLCERLVQNGFPELELFLKEAKSILNRRASRAGRAFENHVSYTFSKLGVPHEMRVREIQGSPDVLIPGKAEYLDTTFPRGRVFMVGLKTSCKDRWRQVTHEAPLVGTKCILTLQPGISARQIDAITESGIKLVVPSYLKKNYPPTHRDRLLSVEQFAREVHAAQSRQRRRR